MNKLNLNISHEKLLNTMLLILLSFSFTNHAFSQKTKPTIISFDVTPVTEGEKGKTGGWYELSWKTENADRVKLLKNGEEIRGRYRQANGDRGWPLTMEGGFTTQAKSINTYTLIAENSVGKVSKEASNALESDMMVKGSPLPEIISFSVTPKTITPGTYVSFYWEVKNALKVELFDSFGEIKAVKGLNVKNDWIASMDGEYKEKLASSENYKLVATNKYGEATKSFTVTVEEKQCTARISLNGKYANSTDAIGVFQAKSNNLGKFIFKHPVNYTKNGVTHFQAIIGLDPGDYFLVPSGGGKDKYGNFGVIYKPGRIAFTCLDGAVKDISIKADSAEY